LRIGKAGEPCIHKSVPVVLPGKWLSILAGNNNGTSYVTTGTALGIVKNMLIRNSSLNDCALHSMPLWNMKTKQEQVSQVSDFEQTITVEDHLLDGGFGSWMLEALSLRPELLTRIRIKALDSRVCGMVGKQSILDAMGGLREEELYP
jgi:transketolase